MSSDLTPPALLYMLLAGEYWALVYLSYLLCKGLSYRGPRSMQWRYDNQILHSEKSIYSPATGVHKTGADEADNGSSTTADKISPKTASGFHHEQVKKIIFVQYFH